ncbi:efflux RND transporter permease subunit [Psychroserpens sp.]|uniref:efflux RND transporter permease subunit n=1 Tax=Psychroserpens sp. TaxID=2020870 RepID=UPI001B2A2F69|nr:efflux RND transporter permease subunit [Psychroserpens sp.]MBO6607792.1 MMPL family transporter [Psychroserpens sp.]MBO6630312.1 MMPL family transporter [Psychroserpens sp.]MBO6654783.1 MMPL family transporter [Psychroserpens sp.]MBO6682793.1 MMPL family transporter [Psychroserpens sp.]MBO6751150.1 MMPL family transporter [Psychroserpens sp.]
MFKLFTKDFWEVVARLILRNKIGILLVIILATIFFSSQWKHMRFTYTEANLLPDDHEVNVVYNDFLKIFGEEGNLIVLGVKDSSLFTIEKLNAWNQLSDDFKAFDEVETVVSINDLQKLVKNNKEERFDLVPFISDSITSIDQIERLQSELFEQYPFYDNFLFNKETKTIRTAIYLKKEIVNTPVRKDFIMETLDDKISEFELANDLDVRISGMPYIRTLNSQNIVDEIGLFIGLALGVTSLIFFLFFRSFRATFISLIVVCVGVMWTFGILGLLKYEITVLTALIPPLIIVIGIPNCIFLINKYQHEVKKHGNKVKSLQRVITKIGNATLMTNVTTASGFATFILTQSKLLKEFGIVASLSILAIFMLCLFVIPIIYTFLPYPKERHLEHLNKRWIGGFVNWIERMVKENKIAIYVTALVLIIASIIGMYKIEISGSLIEDMPKEEAFFKDIRFFEEEFDGIMPLEIMVDTKRKKGVMKLSTLKRMAEVEDFIDEVPELSRPISVVSLVKYSKQAYYNGNPKYYQLPTSQENSFILSYAKNSSSDVDLLQNFVDSTGQYARITTFMKDIGTDKMERIEEDLENKINKVFPEDRYNVTMTGKALVFQKGTKYLVKNLVISLSLAIFLISLFMAYMFRSVRMIIVSLIPNILPLVITAGLMGYLGVPIKPSTILVFSIAFGISVDDTIHFLAKYRQELQANHWKIRKSVYAALRETGVSMFYTSIVLFFGFIVFTTSSFGGTVALGALVSATLLFAMLSNLLLLPSLLLSLERSIANKEVMREPSINIIPEEDDEQEKVLKS